MTALVLPVRWIFSIQSSSSVTTMLKVISSPAEMPFNALVSLTDKSIVIAAM